MVELGWNQGGARVSTGRAQVGPQGPCALRLAFTKRILNRIPPRKQRDGREKRTIHAKPRKTKQNVENKAKQCKAQQNKGKQVSPEIQKNGAKVEPWWNHGETMAEPGRSQGGPTEGPRGPAPCVWFYKAKPGQNFALNATRAREKDDPCKTKQNEAKPRQQSKTKQSTSKQSKTSISRNSKRRSQGGTMAEPW